MMRHFPNAGRMVTVALAVVVASSLSGCEPAATADPAAEAPSLATYTCPQLATEAAAISKGKDLELIKVRAPKIVKDNRKTFKKPTGDKDALVLSCKGTGVWSDNTTAPVVMKLTVDADGTGFVSYEEQ